MLYGKKILITSGPTRAPLDAMRFLTNRSTGKFGTLLAEEALRKRARVTFVYGKGSHKPRLNSLLTLILVETGKEVAQVLKRQLKKKNYDAVIHSMAVLDFQAAKVKRTKTQTKKGGWKLELIPTPKIINSIKKWAPKTILVGFKLEVGVSQKEMLSRARRLLAQSKADFVLANQLTEGDDKKHLGFLLDASGRIVGRAKGKQRLAKLIIQKIR